MTAALFEFESVAVGWTGLSCRLLVAVTLQLTTLIEDEHNQESRCMMQFFFLQEAQTAKQLKGTKVHRPITIDRITSSLFFGIPIYRNRTPKWMAALIFCFEGLS